MATVDHDGIKLEMAYTRWDASCKDMAITADGELVECRRDKRHMPAGVHAVLGGHGEHGIITWGPDVTVSEV